MRLKIATKIGEFFLMISEIIGLLETSAFANQMQVNMHLDQGKK